MTAAPPMDKVDSHVSFASPPAATDSSSLPYVASSSSPPQTLGQQTTTVGINVKQDMALFMQTEGDPDMKRMLKVAVGRIATIPDERKVERTMFMEYIQLQDRRTRDCLAFPCMISYFVLFAATIMLHDDISNVSQVERNFRSMIEGTTFEGTIRPYVLGPSQDQPIWVSGHKTMADIDVVMDIWTWLADAMVPLFIPNLNATDVNDLQRVLRYNQLIGGLQLQQVRKTRVNCAEEYPELGPHEQGTDINPLLRNFDCFPLEKFAYGCFGVNETSPVGGFCPDQDVAGSRRLGLDAIPTRRLWPESQASKVGRGYSVAAWSGSSSFKGDKYTVMLHQHYGVNHALDTLRFLQDNDWLDTSSAWFGMKMFVLNPDLAVYTYIVANVFFPPNGQLIPAVTMSSFPAEPYAYWSVMISDVLFLIVLFRLTVFTMAKLIRTLCKPKKRLKTYVSDFFNWVDLLTCLGGIGIMLYWVSIVLELYGVRESTLHVVLGLQAIVNSTASDKEEAAQQMDTYLDASQELHTTVAAFASFTHTFRVVVAWYSIVVMMRFFQAFTAQPKLAVVTNTIAKAAVDTVHFLIVLVLVVFAYAVGGMCLFGHRLIDFSELTPAMIKCILIALGDFDYDELAGEHPGVAAIWFWSYTVLVAITMLNMLLAIVMDWYAVVQFEAAGDDAIWAQTGKLLLTAWRQREWLRGTVVLNSIDGLDSAITHIDKTLLLSVLPDMAEEQATQLIRDADGFENRVDEQGVSISDAVKMVSWIKGAVLKVARRIEDILRVQNEEKELLTGGDDDDPGGGPNSKLRPRVRKDIAFDEVADQRMKSVESRLAHMENWLSEGMCVVVQKGKEMRNSMSTIEGLMGVDGQGKMDRDPLTFSAWGASPPADAQGFNVPPPVIVSPADSGNQQINLPAQRSDDAQTITFTA